MPRVKRGTIANKRRKNVLSKTKGYRFGLKSKEKMAKEAIRHAGTNAFRDRKNKKRNFRGLWQVKIGAALKEFGISFSKFIDLLKKKNVELNRKVLAEIAEQEPKVFEKIVEEVK